MHRSIAIMIVIASLVFIHATEAHAVGLGIYGSGGAGTMLYYGYTLSLTDNHTRLSTTPLGGGILIDSNVAKDRVFGNRLKLGVERPVPLSGFSFEGWRAGMRNAFGFGVKRSKNIRFWLGPQMGIQYLWGTSERKFFGMDFVTKPEYLLLHPGSYLSLTSPLSNAYLRDKRRYRLVLLEFGLVMGLNINMGETFTLGLEWGGMTQTYAGEHKRVLSEALTGLKINGSKGSGSTSGVEAYASVSLIFRIKDHFNYGKTDPLAL